MDVDSSDSEEAQTPLYPDTILGVGSFSCICGYSGPSGRLLLCRGCLRYQHQQCYYPLCPAGPIQLGTEHYCVKCAPWRGPGFHRETQRTLPPQGQVRCICGLSDFDGMMITCVRCRRFQHQSCCIPELKAGDLFPHFAYFCVDCIGHPDPALRADNIDLLRRHQRALNKARLAPGNRPMLDSVPSLAHSLERPEDIEGSVPSPNRERRDSHTQLVEPRMLSLQGVAHDSNVAFAEVDHLQKPAATSPDQVMTPETAHWDWSTSSDEGDHDVDSILETERGGHSDASHLLNLEGCV